MNAETTVIRAFSADQVERLTGLSKARLFSWDRAGFFVPSYAYEDRRKPFSRIYSFDDVVSLKTLAILRDVHNVQLAELRKAAVELRRHTDRPWSSRKLYVFRGKVVFDEPQTGKKRNVSDGQYIHTCIELEGVAEGVAEAADQLRRRNPATVGKVSRNKFIAGNQWVVDGTRIPTRAVKEFAEAGYSADQIIEEYPDLTVKDVRAAIKHEKKLKAA